MRFLLCFPIVIFCIFMIFEIVCQKRSIWETQIKMLWTVGEEVRLNSKKDHYFKNKTETHSEIQLQGNTDFTTNVITKVQRQWDKITECLVVLQLRDKGQRCLGQLKTDCCIVPLIVYHLAFPDLSVADQSSSRSPPSLPYSRLPSLSLGWRSLTNILRIVNQS